jgi:hypothetical protein
MIEQSVEYRTDQVESVYHQLLNRNADPSGLNSFVGALFSGATVVDIEAAIAGSPEFFQDAGGTKQGLSNALYQELLHRPPDPLGRSRSLTALHNGLSPQALAAVIFSSEEFQADLVTALYEQYLQRQPDPVGFNLSLQALQNGFLQEGVSAALLGSEEYFLSATD